MTANSAYTHTDFADRELTHLTCKGCKQATIPWYTNTLGCPPEYCHECRTKFGKTQDFYSAHVRGKWESLEKRFRNE